MQNIWTVPKKWSKFAFGVDFSQLTLCGPKIWEKWTISLFVYYNCPDHLAQFFCFTSLLSITVEKFVKIHLKRLVIVYILTVIFLSKSECPDKMRPRAGHIGIGPPKLISFKTRHDLHSVGKKVCPKIPKLSTEILVDKVGLNYSFTQNRSRTSSL